MVGPGMSTVDVRLGVAHHLGWAIVVAASADHRVVDRRRIELIETGLPSAPIHHEGGAHPQHRSGELLDDLALAGLVARVRASAVRVASAELNALGAATASPIVSISLRAWPADFPTDIPTLRRVPYEATADSVMYREVLAELAEARGWVVHHFDAARVERAAAEVLGARAGEVLHGPRAVLGPPWSKDHRVALAATVVCAAEQGDRLTG